MTQTCGNFMHLFALISSLQAIAGAQVQLPHVTERKWENGIRLLLMEYHRAPTLNVIALFSGGEIADPQDKAGVSSIVANLLTRGTMHRSAAQIAEEIDFLGGSLDPSAGPDGLSIGLRVLAKDSEAGLDLLADTILHPTFAAEELERERQLKLSGLQSLREDPSAVCSRVATETVFTGHPYGRMATVASVQSITRDDITSYYSRAIGPGRMTIVAVGDFRTAEIEDQLRKRFGDWQTAALVPLITASTSHVRRVVMIDKPDATQTQVRLVRTAIPRAHPDYIAAEIASTIVGGGFTSRLVDEVRVNRSLTYGIGCSFNARKDSGTFVVSTFTKIETTRQLLDVTNKVLRKAATQGLTQAELTKFKSYLAGSFAIEMQRPDAIARQLVDVALYGLPIDYLQTYLAKINTVKLADVNRITRKYMLPESLSIVLVGPAQKVMSQVKEFGCDIETRSVDTVGQ